MTSSQFLQGVAEPVQIVVAGEQEIPQLVALARETFYATWSPVNTDEDLAIFMDEAFHPEKVRKEIGQPAVFTFLLVRSGNELAGYAKLRRDTVFESLPDVSPLEIEKFYFLKKFFGTGLSDQLMRSVLSIAEKEGKEWVCLGVDVNNHRAARFYERYGFEKFGSKSFRVGNQVDTDNLMKRK
ncbi:MAG: GNAT family N-acetyltransferase, partial [Bacteroidota bacterium]